MDAAVSLVLPLSSSPSPSSVSPSDFFPPPLSVAVELVLGINILRFIS